MFKLFGSQYQFVYVNQPPSGGEGEALPNTNEEFVTLANELNIDDKKERIESYFSLIENNYDTAFKAVARVILVNGSESEVDLLFEFFYHPEFYGRGSKVNKFQRALERLNVAESKQSPVSDESATPGEERVTINNMASQSTLLPVDRIAEQTSLYKYTVSLDEVMTNELSQLRLSLGLDDPSFDKKWLSLLELDPRVNAAGGYNGSDQAEQDFKNAIAQTLGESYVNDNPGNLDILTDNLLLQNQRAQEIQTTLRRLLINVQDGLNEKDQRERIMARFNRQTGIGISEPTETKPVNEYFYTDEQGRSVKVEIKPEWFKEYDQDYETELKKSLTALPERLLFEVGIYTPEGKIIKNMSAAQLRDFSKYDKLLLEFIPTQAKLNEALNLTAYGQTLEVGTKIDYLIGSDSEGNQLMSDVIEILAIDEETKMITVNKPIQTNRAEPINELSFAEFSRWLRSNAGELISKPETQQIIFQRVLEQMSPERKQGLINAGEKVIVAGLKKGLRMEDKYCNRLSITNYDSDQGVVSLSTGEVMSESQFVRTVKENEIVGLFDTPPDDNSLAKRREEEELLREEQLAGFNARQAKSKIDIARSLDIEASKGPGVLLTAWQSIEFYSLGQMLEMFELVGEQVKEILKNNDKLKGGSLGERLLPESLGGSIAKQQKISALQAIVKRHMDALENISDSDKIWDKLDASDDLFYVYACIKVLAERGRLRFDDQRLWKALNRCIKGTNDRSLRIPVDAFKAAPNKAQSSIYKVLNTLIGSGKGEEMFENNSSKFTAEVRKYDAEADKLNGDQQLIPELYNMLDNWRTDSSNDSHRFLSFLEYAIKEDEVNGAQMMYLIRGAFTVKNEKGITLLPNRLISTFGQYAKKYFPIKHFLAFQDSNASNALVDGAKIDDPNNIDESAVWARIALVDLWKRKTIEHGGKGKQECNKDSIHLAINAFPTETIKEIMGIGNVGMYATSRDSLQAIEMVKAVGGFGLIGSSFAMVPEDVADRAKFDKKRKKFATIESHDMMERLVKNFIIFKAGTLGQAGNQKRDASFLNQDSHGQVIKSHYLQLSSVISASLMAVNRIDSNLIKPDEIKIIGHTDIIDNNAVAEAHKGVIEDFSNVMDRIFRNENAREAFMTTFIRAAKNGDIGGIHSTASGHKTLTGITFNDPRVLKDIKIWDDGHKDD